MKLLLDENLSPRLLPQLLDLYPGSAHVRELGLASATDEQVRERARRDGFAIVTKDSDFREATFALGHPPKVVWIRLGNCSTQEVADLLRAHAAALHAFDADPDAAYLALG